MWGFQQELAANNLIWNGVIWGVFAVAALMGIVGLWELQTFQLKPSSYKVIDILTLTENVGREQGSEKQRAQPVNRARGIVFLILGILILAFFGPINLFNPITAWIPLGGFWLLIKSRQNFQVSANSLLAADQRQPVLFLRAFVDDPSMVVHRTVEQMVKVVDFSVETRLANYFMNFGPFMAVGSPGEKVPVPGAARVHLSDDQWQKWVINHIRAANIVVMYAGVTQWVAWELSHILEAGMTGKLILLFPSAVTQVWRRRGMRKKFAALLVEDMTNRLAQVKATFAGTPWQAAWEGVGAPETLIAARVDRTGGITLFRSKRRNNDAFHIAAEITHLIMLERITLRTC